MVFRRFGEVLVVFGSGGFPAGRKAGGKFLGYSGSQIRVPRRNMASEKCYFMFSRVNFGSENARFRIATIFEK